MYLVGQYEHYKYSKPPYWMSKEDEAGSTIVSEHCKSLCSKRRDDPEELL